MCSRKCDLPVWPSSSLREPTRYQMIVATTGLSCCSLAMTVRPFARVIFCTPRVRNDASGVACGAAWSGGVINEVITMNNHRELKYQRVLRHPCIHTSQQKIVEAAKRQCQTHRADAGFRRR